MVSFEKSGKAPVRTDSGASARRAFALSAGLSIGVYAIFCIYFSFGYSRASYFLRDLSNVVLVPGLSVLLFAYWRGYCVLKEQPSLGVSRTFFFGAVTALVALLIPDFYSSDLLSYVNYGWQQAGYHINPYVLMLVATPGFGTDPMFTKIWELNPFPYGFTFAHIARFVCEIGHGNQQYTVHLFKWLNFCVFLVLSVVIYVGAKRLKLPRPDLSMYLFMGSPLLLLHCLCNGHNDIVMVFFVMLSFLLAAFNVLAVVLPLLIVGALVKYVWLFAMPFVLLYLFRRAGWKMVVVNLFVTVVAFVCLAWSYIGDWRDFQWQVLKHNLDVNANSLPAVIFNLSRATEQVIYGRGPLPGFDAGLDAVISATKLGLFVSFVGFAVCLLCRAFKDKSSYTLSRVIEICVLGTMIATCLVASKFYPWYVIMFFPVALWLPQRSELRRLAIMLSCTQLFAITFLGHGHVLNFVLLTCVPFALSFLRWRKTTRRRA
jgi:hypothetical protein